MKRLKKRWDEEMLQYQYLSVSTLSDNARRFEKESHHNQHNRELTMDEDCSNNPSAKISSETDTNPQGESIRVQEVIVTASEVKYSHSQGHGNVNDEDANYNRHQMVNQL
jgi:hypothetical protein